MTLGSFCRDVVDQRERARQLTFLGAMLFSRGVSGARYAPPPTRTLKPARVTHLCVLTRFRVVSCLDTKSIGGRHFESYGAHRDAYPEPYVTFACAIGMERREVDALVVKLRKTLAEWRAKLPTPQDTPRQ